MRVAYVGLGSNVDPERNLPLAIERIRSGHEVVAVSPIYESAAEGMEGPPFRNAVVALETDLDADELREALKRLEVACGRPRDHDKWEPRTLDADLLIHGDEFADVLEGPWILVPLVDVAPDLVHPTEGRRLARLLAQRRDWKDTLRLV